MAPPEHVYSYLAPSTVRLDGGRAEVSLATSGGPAAHPWFFSGSIASPRQTAQALLVVAEVARTRYYEHPSTTAARLRLADPLVTSHGDRLRFESFSVCAGVYSRLDLDPAALDGAVARCGTTNVDFNPPMRAALARVRDADGLLVDIGHDEVRVSTPRDAAVERRVPLPDRWLKGLAEVQVASAGMVLRHELPAPEARHFLRSLPRARSRGVAWAAPAGGGLRLSAHRAGAVACLAGPERLRLLENLLPFARTLRLYGPMPSDARAEPSAWELVLGAARLVFVLSPDVSRGFSGEGGVLSAVGGADEEILEALAERLHGQAQIEAGELAENLQVPRDTVWTGLAALGAAGRVGFDLGASAFFHRELPFERDSLKAMHPRLIGAHALLDAGAVEPCEGGARVRSRDADYLVTWDAEGARCTCTWFARYRGGRGPCKHVLAAELARKRAPVGA